MTALLGAWACGAPPDEPPSGDRAYDELTPELEAAVESSLDHLAANAGRFGLAGRGDLQLTRAFEDELGLTHTRFQQTVGGVPVLGGEAIVHLGRDRSIWSVTDAFVPQIAVDTSPKVSSGEAIGLALSRRGCTTCLAAPPDVDLWAMRHEGRDRLVWRVQLRLDEETNRVSLPVMFIDAHEGELVWQYDNLQTGTGSSLYSGTVTVDTLLKGTTTYYMEDVSRKLGTYDMWNTTSTLVDFYNFDDTWTDARERAGVDAHYGARMTYEYFKNVHNRNGLDGNGGPTSKLSRDGVTRLLPSRVHYGTSYSNAFWDGSKMTYGDGDGSLFLPLVSLDVIGHEMMHGVIKYTAGLQYSGESGALNESYADIFGAMVERYARGESSATWKIGEEIYTPAAPDDALRYLDDPHKGFQWFPFTADDDPDHYSERYTGPADNGGVHVNSGIGNKTFYLLAMGGSHHLGGSMTGIGADKAAAIWYKALTAYMTYSTNFARAARATYDAAVALHGAGSPEAAAVVTAWGLTGITVDIVPPVTAITTPADGGTVIAPMIIWASASDNVGVTKHQFLIDGVVVQTVSGTAPQYGYIWNTIAYADGPHTIAARAFDTIGNWSQSATITVTLAHEHVPPVVAITAPANGATVVDLISVMVEATDNVAIKKLELHVDGALRGTCSTASCMFGLDTFPLANGPHTLAAKAFDTVGNSATSAAVTIIVDNDHTAPAAAITAPVAGETVTGIITVTADASDNVGVTRVDLLVDGLLAATDTAAPWELSWDTAMAVGDGAHSFAVRAYDAKNNAATSSAVSIITKNPDLAAYDATFRAPRCAAEATACDTGGLVKGRLYVGEPNGTNTIGPTCNDGTSGTYHASQSLDRLRVSSLDGLPITAGQEIRIEATTWVMYPPADRLHLYHTSTPGSPVWTYIGALTPSGTGAQVLSTTFTLPPGTQHAIRGQFPGGSATTPCVITSVFDRDDLVFTAVDPLAP